MAENERNHHFNVEIHIPFPNIEGDIYIISDQEMNMNSKSRFYAFLLPFEIVIEEEKVVLDHFENGETIQDFTAFEITKSKTLENQGEILVESCEGSSLVIPILQDMVVPFVVFQQYTKPFFDLDEKDDNQAYVFPI